MSWAFEDLIYEPNIPSVDELARNLEQLRKEVLDVPNLTEEETMARKVFLSEQMMTGGGIAFQGINIADKVARTTHRVHFDTFACVKKIDSGMTSAGAWVFAGIVLAARTGLDYRRLKNNEIDQNEFNKNLRQNTAGTIGSVLGGAAGVAIGLPLGAYLYKGLGAIICGGIFGVTGGMLGESLMQTAEEQLDQALQSNRQVQVQ